MDRTAAWKPPAINKTLAKQVAKVVDKHWAVTGVKSLQDIRDAIGKAVANPMSMRDRVDNQDAIKKWKAKISRDDLHKLFRWVEEAKFKGSKEQYRTTDEALRALKAHRNIALRVAARYSGKKPKDPQEAVNKWLKKSKITDIIQGMGAEARKDKLQFGMRDAREALKLWFAGTEPKDPKHVAAWRYLKGKGKKQISTLVDGIGKVLKDNGGGRGFKDIAKAVDTWMGY